MQEHPKNDRSPSRSGRRAVLDALRSFGGPASVQQLADRLGLHTNTVRFHLIRLVQAGLVEEELAPVVGPGRPRLCYRPVTGDGRADDRGEVTGSLEEYRLLSQILAGYLASNTDDPSAAAVTAGRQWGRYLVDRPPPIDRLDDGQTVARVAAMLDRLGFQPETAAGTGEIQLHRCPFREVAERQPGVVCSVHLGLLQGAMSELGADGSATRLDPFVTERLCVAHLALSAAPAETGDRPGPAEQETDDATEISG